MQPLNVKYNSQRNNRSLEGLRGSAQCGYTAAAMMISPFLAHAENDEFIFNLIEAMEPRYGKARWSDRILDRVPWARGMRLGMFGDSYVIALNALFEELDLPYQIEWIPTGGTPEQLKQAIDAGSPAMLSTMITPSGHYICVIGYDDDHWICHDPYGNGYAPGGYRTNTWGERVYYPKSWLESRARAADPNRRGLRFMHATPRLLVDASVESTARRGRRR